MYQIILTISCFLAISITNNAFGRNVIYPQGFRHFQGPPTNHALVARKIVHKSQWTAMGTLSTLKSISGYPMVNVISVVDGPKNNSTGVIYFYLTNLDFTGQDTTKNNSVTAFFSDDENLNCTKNSIDPMEPTCARIMISGSTEKLSENTTEYSFATSAFISRHPAAKNWIKAHHFYLCKLNIKQIAVLDWYGGPHFVTPEEYYKANPN